MPTLLMIVAVFLLSVNAWAEGLNKSNSLTVENDPRTSSWTATCDISVSGVDPHQIYSGVMLFQFLPSFGGPTVGIFNVLFQVGPGDRTWTESLPGIYKVKATLRGREVAVRAEVNFNTIIGGDRVSCASRIDPGSQPPVSPTLFGSNMVSTVQTP
jgi:hypothetical protein